MKTGLQPLLAQDSALGAFFDAMLSPQAPLSSSRPPRVAGDAGAAGADAEDAPQHPVSEPDAIRALLFEVAGLTLALPLQAVKEVLPDAQISQPAPQRGGAVIGTFIHGEISSRVVDTARLVLPADRAAQPGVNAAPRTRCLIVLGDGQWSLACERTIEVVELDRASIKWRTAEGKRLWLAGMVAGRQCALLDVEGLCRLLTGQMA